MSWNLNSSQDRCGEVGVKSASYPPLSKGDIYSGIRKLFFEKGARGDLFNGVLLHHTEGVSNYSKDAKAARLQSSTAEGKTPRYIVPISANATAIYT
jgi:hypothetical protein